MTQQEIEAHRQLRASIVASLPDYTRTLAALHDKIATADKRICTYLRGIAAEPEIHNYYEIAGAWRFLKLLERHIWKPERVRHFLRFYEALRFSGMGCRQHYKLTPVQCFQFASIFGLYENATRRLTRTAYIYVPRKFSKTTSAAALAVYDLLFGDNNAQAYVGANSYEQAKICFDEIRKIMLDIDPRGRHVRVNREKIFFEGNGRDAFARCLTSNARTHDGLNASLIIMDEYSQARDSNLKTVLTTSTGVRINPLTVVITTASDVFDGPFFSELQGLKAILRGEVESDSIFAHIFEPDAGDPENSPTTWRKVQPHLGVTVQLDFYEKAYQAARLSAEDMLAFRTKLLNVYADNEQEPWIPAKVIKGISEDFTLDDFEGCDAMVALDLSVRGDFSAVSCGVYSEKEDKYYIHTDYFFPRGALSGHANEKMYRMWAAQGHLHLLDGDVMDYEAIAQHILEFNDTLRILAIGYDAYKSQECINILSAAGAADVVTVYRQTHGAFNLPVELFEHAAYNRRVAINSNPINGYCFGNAVLRTDYNDNSKPHKRTQRGKIDGVITTLMVIGLFAGYER